MVSAELLLEHFLALGLVWIWVFLAGLPLVILLRIPLGLVAAPLLGIAFWAAALYVFSFPHGLDFTAALVVLGAAATLLRRQYDSRRYFRAIKSPGLWILMTGCGAYATLLFTHYLPSGFDASMYTTAARLIAEQHGLPKTFAPFLPDLEFSPINQGVPALAAVAIRLGISPEAAMLSGEQLTFSSFILALYLLLRLWTSRTSAAFLAVYGVWTAKGAQKTAEWGGFPTVAGLALGLFATRLLIDLVRRPRYSAACVLGLTVASLPLVHGISAGVWFYVVAPVTLLVAMGSSRRPLASVKPLVVAGAIATLILTAYVIVGKVAPDDEAIGWTRSWQANDGPQGEGWSLVPSIYSYWQRAEGSSIRLGLLAVVVLLLRRRFMAVSILVLSVFLLSLLLANSRSWLLPMSALLYPERVVYWLAPLMAVALALAWRSLPRELRRSWLMRLIVVGMLSPFAVVRHVQSFQWPARHAHVTRPYWEALRWASKNLDPERDYVSADFNSAGAFLPAVAGVATSGWQIHHFMVKKAKRALGKRVVTHVFVDRARQAPDVAMGEVVFENSHVTIFRVGRF